MNKKKNQLQLEKYNHWNKISINGIKFSLGAVD